MANYISYGMKGDNVKALQEQLNAYGGAGLQADGIFGPKTKAALENFQKTSGITVDGIYGNETMGAFNSLQGTQNSVQAPTTSSAPIGGQTTPTADVNGVQSFNYDYSTDPLYQKQAALTQSQIAQQMAARGILNSTIDQERTAQALGGLGLDFKQQAYQQYTADRTYQQQQQRQIKEDAWTTAQERGYFNNEEARAWGLTPGTKTASAKAREAAAAQSAIDAQQSASNAQGKATAQAHSDYVNAVKSSFESNFGKFGQEAVLALVDDPNISQEEFDIILKGTKAQEYQDKTAWQVWTEIQSATNSPKESAPFPLVPTSVKGYNQLADPARGARGYTK